MGAATRQKRIIEHLGQTSFAEVTTLSELLHVSEMTVRRDLDILEKENVLIRVHGGARLLSQKMYEPPLDDRLREKAEEKYALGKYAASLVEAGDAIALDDSSTTFAMVPFLSVPLTVITNHISVACALAANDQIEVILLGGKVRRASQSMTGRDMEAMLAQYRVDKAFLSAKAVDVHHGISDATEDEGASKQAFMAAGKRVFYLFDSSKLATSAFYKVCPVGDTTDIVMNKAADKTQPLQELRQYCAEHEVTLHLI